MNVWRVLRRRTAGADAAPPAADRVGPTEAARPEQRQAVSPEQFERSPVHVLFGA